MSENFYQFFVFWKQEYMLRFGGVYASNIEEIIEGLGGKLEKVNIENSSFNEFMIQMLNEAITGRNMVIVKYLQNGDYLNDDKQTLSSFLTFFARSMDIKKVVYPKGSNNPLWILYFYKEK